jgi:hypothetical protein
MTLGVKECISKKQHVLSEDGREFHVCGGKGAVYLSGDKVALRCCTKTAIIVTRQMKQTVLRLGMVCLMDPRYSN